MKEIEKVRNLKELTIKFTKVLAEFLNQVKLSGFRYDLPKSVIAYLSDNIDDVVNRLTEDDIELMNLEVMLYHAAEYASDNSEVIRLARIDKFIPNDSGDHKLVLKYKLLAYLRDAMRELKSNNWGGASGAMVDDLVNKKHYSYQPKHEKSNIVELANEFPDQEEARAMGGMYLPKMISFSKNGIGLVQFNYDMSSLINDEED